MIGRIFPIRGTPAQGLGGENLNRTQQERRGSCDWFILGTCCMYRHLRKCSREKRGRWAKPNVDESLGSGLELLGSAKRWDRRLDVCITLLIGMQDRNKSSPILQSDIQVDMLPRDHRVEPRFSPHSPQASIIHG